MVREIREVGVQGLYGTRGNTHAALHRVRFPQNRGGIGYKE